MPYYQDMNTAAAITYSGFRIVGGVEPRVSGSYWEPPSGGNCADFEVCAVWNETEAVQLLEEYGFDDPDRYGWLLAEAERVRKGDLSAACAAWVAEKFAEEIQRALERSV